LRLSCVAEADPSRALKEPASAPCRPSPTKTKRPGTFSGHPASPRRAVRLYIWRSPGGPASFGNSASTPQQPRRYPGFAQVPGNGHIVPARAGAMVRRARSLTRCWSRCVI
jgi:hypothetical protein